ncbi:MAG: hypothetical protein Q4P17_10745 [Methanobacterium sp.]|nr:hypothetical protein [Methanobacterium sp.]
MKINLGARVLLINSSTNLSKDGTKEYYNVAVEQNGQAGTLSCTDEVYKFLQSQENHCRFKFLDLHMVYDDQYRYLRVENATISKNQNMD